MRRWNHFALLCVAVIVGSSVGPCSAEQWSDLGIKAKDVSVSGATMWVIGEDDRVYFATSSGWQPHATVLTGATVIDVGPDQKPVVAGPSGWKIYKSNGSSWYEIPGATASRISVDAQNRPWISWGGGRHFHYYDGQGWKNANIGYGLGIESNAAGVMAAIGNGEGPHRITNGTWQNLGAQSGMRVVDLDIDGRGYVWVADNGGNLLSYDGSQWRRHQPPQGAVRVSVSEAGQPVVLGRDARVYICTDCVGQVAPPPPQPTVAPPQVNRPPNAPTVEPGGFEPPFPIGYEGAIHLSWRNNGDPDGDPLAFWIEIWFWHPTQGQWVQMRSEWVTGTTTYTLTINNGLVANIHYAWRVAACDTGRRSDPWFVWSNYSVFKTAQ